MSAVDGPVVALLVALTIEAVAVAGAAAVSPTATETGAPMTALAEGTLSISPLQAALTSDPAFPAVGEKTTVVLSVSNTGAAAVSNLQAGLAVASGTVYVGAVTGPSPAAPVSLPPNGGVSFTWTLSVTGAGPVSLTASATGMLAPPGGGVAGIATLALRGHRRTQLTATITPNPLDVSGGEWFSLVMTVSNTGSVAATDVIPELSIYAGAPLASPQAGPEPASAETLRPGQSERFVFTYSANGSGTVSFSGTVTAKASLDQPGWISRQAAGTTATTRRVSKRAGERGREIGEKVRLFLFPPSPPEPAEAPFMGFERPGDLAWTTDGYVALAGSEEHVTEGKRSLEAEFLLPRDLTFSATGDWRPAIRLQAPARGTRKALEIRDWSGFTAFRADCHNASSEPIELTVTIIDRRGYQYAALRHLAATSSTTMDVPLADAESARLDLERVRELSVAVNTTGLKARPVVYLDNLRFALPPAAPSSTLLHFSATATGRKTGGL